jgi:hypothetical protein
LYTVSLQIVNASSITLPLITLLEFRAVEVFGGVGFKCLVFERMYYAYFRKKEKPNPHAKTPPEAKERFLSRSGE